MDKELLQIFNKASVQHKYRIIKMFGSPDYYDDVKNRVLFELSKKNLDETLNVENLIHVMFFNLSKTMYRSVSTRKYVYAEDAGYEVFGVTPSYEEEVIDHANRYDAINNLLSSLSEEEKVIGLSDVWDGKKISLVSKLKKRFGVIPKFTEKQEAALAIYEKVQSGEIMNIMAFLGDGYKAYSCALDLALKQKGEKFQSRGPKWVINLDTKEIFPSSEAAGVSRGFHPNSVRTSISKKYKLGGHSWAYCDKKGNVL